MAKRSSRKPARRRKGSDPGVRVTGAKRNSWQFPLAHEMWVEQCASIEQVVDACEISRNTLAEWRKAYDWDIERQQVAKGWGETLMVLRQALGRATVRLQNDRSSKALQNTLRTVERILDNAAR